MSLSAEERKERMRRYAEGAARLKAAWAKVPEKARQWRPAPGKWSAHEIVCHCADSEANGALRIRYVLAEKEPVIVGYDQDEWARAFDYHAHPVELALQTVEAVRANTAALLARLPESAWSRAGRHSESGPYTAENWLDIYAEHLEKHSGQIERNLAAWEAAGRP
jgi:DinB superfamily